MNKDNFYITTPIYYVNDVPHIGHAYTTLAADVIARFMRLSGKNVMFLTGTDEHGQKVEKSAMKAEIEPQRFVDKNSASFRQLFQQMNISYDDFIRTTEVRHKKSVAAIWQKLIDNKAIYLGKYSGWYCLPDEAFYSESELREDGKAPTGADVEWVEEPSYFFALSKWQDKLLEFYENNPDFIKPESRRNEVISFVKSGLHDLSVSRTSFKWGVSVPNDLQHVIYVWLDALTNYISAVDYPEDTEKFQQFWPANVHIVGKDILRFHAVYWPAFLMASGIELPKTIIAHGWWTNEGQKISKRLGNVIDPLQLIAEFGLDQTRYLLMREVIFGNDGNYSKESFILLNNSELANKIGNLMQRTCSFVYKNCDARIPNVNTEFIDSIYKTDLFIKLAEIINNNLSLMQDYKINSVLDNIIYITEQANIYIDKEAPWNLKNTDQKKMQQVLYLLLELLRYIAIMLQPFMPDSAGHMLDQLNIAKDNREFKHLNKDFAIKPDMKINKPTAIFPRLDK
ncbi:MAG: methionine--tRNA ligase, partial [Rickettsiaceae bacterium]|nr:methionine--tRNA ligase [Rickettsiaceae bacterium]